MSAAVPAPAASAAAFAFAALAPATELMLRADRPDVVNARPRDVIRCEDAPPAASGLAARALLALLTPFGFALPRDDDRTSLVGTSLSL